MNDSELFLCPGAAFSHLRTSPTCDMMGTTKVSEKPHDRGKKRGKSDDAKESIKENMIMAREIINTEKAPAAIGPYVQAVADNGLLFISGQLGFDVEHGSVIPETVEEQATLSLKNLDAIMTAAGTDRTKVMKTTIFLTDMNDFAKVNEVYGAFFGESKPARSCVAVAALPRAAKVEIECIVSLK